MFAKEQRKYKGGRHGCEETSQAQASVQAIVAQSQEDRAGGITGMPAKESPEKDAPSDRHDRVPIQGAAMEKDETAFSRRMVGR
jgi:hypothetical protein